MHRTPRRTGVHRRHWVGIIVVVMAVVLVVANAPEGSFASWRDGDSGEGSLAMGSFSFQLADVSGQNASPADPREPSSPQYTFMPLSQAAGDMLPGSTYAAEVKVANTGTTALTLAVTAARVDAGTDAKRALASALSVAVRSNSGTCRPSDFGSATFTPLDQVTPERPLVLVAAASPLASQQSARVCVALRLAATAPTSTQGQSLPIALDLRADQHR